MPNEITIVQYDTTQAIQALDDLDKSVKDSAQHAEQSFKKGAAASQKFDKSLQVLSPRASGLVNSFKKLAGAVGPVGLAIGTATAALGSLAANAVDLPRLLRDTSDAMDEVHKGLDRLTQLENQQIDLQVTIDTQEVRQQIKRINEEALPAIAEQRVAISIERDVAQERLEIQKNLFSQIDSLAKQSAQKRQALERGVASIREKQFLRSIDRLDPGVQIKKLLDRAAQAREKGDFGGAERLLDRAGSVSEQSGVAFGRRQLIEEENRLIEAMERAAAAHGNAQKAQESAAAVAKQQISNLQTEIKLLQQANEQLKNRQKLLGVQTTRLAKAEGDIKDEGERTKAINERTAALQKLLDLQQAERSGFEKFKDFGRASLSAIGGGTGQGREQSALIKQAQDAANRAVSQFGEGTVQGDQKALENLKQIDQILTKLRKDGVQGAFEFNVGNLEKFLSAARQLREATREFIANEGGKGAIGVRTPAQNIPATAPNAGRQLIPVNQQTGAAAVPGNVAQIFNINVRGGIIDPEVSRAIADEVRRQTRRGTGPGTR